MLDYAMIGKKNRLGLGCAKHDEFISFLQSCSCLLELNLALLIDIQ
jgi:hypothetical protein